MGCSARRKKRERGWGESIPTLKLGVRMTGVTKQKFMSQNLSKKETSGLHLQKVNFSNFLPDD